MALMTRISNVAEKVQDAPVIHKRPPKIVGSISRARFQKPRPNINISSKRSEVGVNIKKSTEVIKNDEIKTDIKKEEKSDIGGNDKCLNVCIIEDSQEATNTSLIRNSSTYVPSIESSFKSEIAKAVEVVSSNKDGGGLFKDILFNKNTSTPKQALLENETSEKSETDNRINEELIISDEKTSENCEDLFAKTSKSLSNDVGTTTHNSTIISTSVLPKKTVTHNLEDPSLKRPKPIEIQSDICLPASKENNDRSSRYPHLTNLLSKKRPEHSTIHRKRKRTMQLLDKDKLSIGDIIYCNLGSSANSETCVEDETAVDETSSVLEEPEILNTTSDDIEDGKNLTASVPKLIVSQNGEIDIDASSLIVSRTQSEKILTLANVSEDVTYSSFRKRSSRQWSTKETTDFYKALSLVGTDFGLMEKLLPHRNRRELKLKFKREERMNLNLINRAMYEPQTFDINKIEDHIESINVTQEVADVQVNQTSDGNIKKRGRKAKGTKKASIEIVISNDTSLMSDISDKVENISSSFSVESRDGNFPDPSEKVENISSSFPVELRDGNFPDPSEKVENISNSFTFESRAVSPSSKRRRKEKALPEDFVDVDEIEIDIDYKSTELINDEQFEDNEVINDEQFEGNKVINDEQFEDNKVINGEQFEDNEVINGEQFEDNEVIVLESLDNDHIKVIENGVESSEMNPVINVVANEVVTSQNRRRRRRKTNYVLKPILKLLERKTHLSSSNYTPSDDTSVSQFQAKNPNRYTMPRNHGEFSSIDELKLNDNTLISFEVSPKDITLSQDPADISSNEVMVVAKSPSNENVLHVFHYKNPT